MQLSLLRSFASVRKEIQLLRSLRLPVLISESDLHETFQRGSGPGGQATNKTSNAVLLTHIPTKIQVKCHKTRSLELNRKEARKILWSKLDAEINKEKSLEALKEMEKQERTRQAKRKSIKKMNQKEDQKGEKEENE